MMAAGKRWIIVGNGPSVLCSRLGAWIDDHDEVVRFNRYVLRGFESHTGIKTTLWVFCGPGVSPADADQRPDRALQVYGTPGYEPREIIQIPRRYYDTKRREVQRASTMSCSAHLLPSSGFLAVAWLLETGQADSVNAIGLDHFCKQVHQQHHYWQPEAFTAPREHDGQAEAILLSPFVRAGTLRYVRDGRSKSEFRCATRFTRPDGPRLR